LARSVEPSGLFVRGRTVIDPFTIVVAALGFAMVASLMLAAIEQ
jgi:hypothetical protein